MRKALISFLCFVYLTSSCSHFDENGLSEQNVIDTLRQLKEIVESDKHIKSISNNRKSISFIIQGPTTSEPNFICKVGYNGKERFETYYTFAVDPITKNIQIEDVVQANRINLDEWRKTNSVSNN